MAVKPRFQHPRQPFLRLRHDPNRLYLSDVIMFKLIIPCSPRPPAPRYHAGQAAPPALMQDGHMDALGARSSLLSKLYIRSNVIML